MDKKCNCGQPALPNDYFCQKCREEFDRHIFDEMGKEAIEEREGHYNVQCLSGCVYAAPRASELEKRCIKRQADGFLDALVLSKEECQGCRDDYRNHLLRELRFCEDIGCPMGPDDCKNGCVVLAELNLVPV